MTRDQFIKKWAPYWAVSPEELLPDLNKLLQRVWQAGFTQGNVPWEDRSPYCSDENLNPYRKGG